MARRFVAETVSTTPLGPPGECRCPVCAPTLLPAPPDGPPDPARITRDEIARWHRRLFGEVPDA